MVLFNIKYSMTLTAGYGLTITAMPLVVEEDVPEDFKNRWRMVPTACAPARLLHAGLQSKGERN
jgi:hypothetical protein